MIIDEKGKLFKKINIIDLALLLVIVISIGATVYKFGFSTHKSVVTADTKITYVLRVKAIRQMAVDAINIDDVIYETVTKKAIGKIVDKKVTEATEFVNMADGTLSKEDKIPEKFDVYLTVEAKGLVSNDGYFVEGNHQLNIFSNVNFSTKTVETMGTIMEIK